jgi:hypothetical protein
MDPDLLVHGPDGRHVRVAMSWTNYARSPDDSGRTSPPPLLDVDGLRQIVHLMERMRAEKDRP